MKADHEIYHETTVHKVIKEIPWSETCFGCNGGPNEGIGARAYLTNDEYIVGLFTAKDCHQGYPGIIHGGIVSTYFDEILWHATRIDDPDTVAMTIEMSVKYINPIKPNMELRVVAPKARFEGRHAYVDGMILLPDDTVAATSTIHYVCVRPENELNKNEKERIKHTKETELFDVEF